MSGGSGGGIGRGNGAAAASGIPAGARRMVQTIKEIVNLPDQEIYVTLKGCGMDPSEAVQRLLSQDSFHEVKSKRDKKKELHQAKVDEIPEIQQSAESESLQEGSPRSESLSEMENSLEISEVKTKVDVINTSLSQRHLFEQQNVNDFDLEISSAVANLQKLSLQKDGLVAPSLEDNPAVIIPRHLQVTNADCSHLSFGSFSSGISTTFPDSSSSNQLNCNLEVTDVADGFPSLHKSDARNSNYYDNGGLTSQINEDAVSRSAMSSMTYDMSTASVSEVIQDDAKNRTREISYNFPSLSGYGASSSTQQSAIAFAAPQASLQMQNLASLSTLMQSYTSSLQSSLLQPTLQPLRDLDLPFSPLLTTQSVSAKHSAETSISGPAISMSEVKPNAFPNLEPSQSSSGNNVPVGHSIPQQLPIHHYSQATLPLGPFANVISYPFLPPSYTYLPSAAFPQPYTSNGPFHQSLAVAPNAALKYSLPQYKKQHICVQFSSASHHSRCLWKLCWFNHLWKYNIRT
ncbi:hypothetical protein HPP92_021015 [Vanilla planifolia]|uniref:GBF-interacting protein 1 N-terminal domain-containing protein n=1 Tax=Vanilla planifolia TaxID=51239 RepID=A0A835Q3T2_VANPL|nr:hypothetical protein HPP92_021015 [Vanilla planifolia]